ncbi:MAG TPA: VanZ family protein [Verrucomicrobium sp.]|nr:VanZ family protein [Verrucomicrobium sp.]
MLSRPLPWFLCVLAWFTLLFYLSSRRMPEIPGPEIPNVDKIIHCLYFAGGATCLYVGLRLKYPAKKAGFAFGAAVLFCAIIGLGDEFHQTFTPGRMGNDPLDWMADVAGGFLGAGIGSLLHGWVKTKPLVQSAVSR